MSAEDEDTIESGRVIAERYRVERKLGAGGMGAVYLVRHVHTEERLALKILHSAVIADTSALERFRREARTPARIDSDYAVRVTDADVADDLGGAPFLVMEYLRGEDLEQLSERKGALPAPVVVSYLRQAARALDKAHALGIVHRDLKPENLFLTTREDGSSHVKILDFGIAKFTMASGDTDMVKTAATSPGAIFGTPLYMSPEQAKGESSNVCAQTDVWAVGLIAHKLLSGRDLWTAQTLTHLIAQIAYEPVPVPSKVGVQLGAAYDAWLLRCCEREPKDRWPAAGEAVSALAQALGVNTGPMESVPEPAIDSAPASISVAVTGADGVDSRSPDAFSKTDHQLATTGGSKKRESTGKLPILAGGLALAVGIVGVLVVQPWGETGPAANGAETTTPTADTAPNPEQTKVIVSPIDSAEGLSTIASVDASASASASSAPTATGDAPPPAVTTPPAQPPPAKPPPAKPPPAKPPPAKPVDPLAGRH